MKNLRKVLVTGLSLVLFGSVLVACGGSNDSSKKASSNSSKPSVSTPIGSSNSSSSSSSVHNHNYGDWNITVEPTLTQTGTAEKNCEANDDTIVETLPVLTESSVWSVTDEKAATCTEDGYVVYSSVYGDVTLTIVATDHSYGNWTIETAPTFETEGLATRECSENDNIDEKVLPVLSNEEFWTLSEKVDSTCDEAGYAVYTSDFGSVRIEYNLRNHNIGEWSIVDTPVIGEKSTATVSRECLYEDCTFVDIREVEAQKSLSIAINDYENSNADVIEVAAGSSYFFKLDGNGNWVSNNADKHGTSATLSFSPKVDGTLTFDVVVSSENGWDKFNYDGKSLSGEESATVTIEMTAGLTYQVSYEKDSGMSAGKDNAILSNIVFSPVVEGEVSFFVLDFITNAEEIVVDPVVVTNRASVDCMPAELIKEGYAFAGWYLEETFETEYKGTAIFENTTVYAKWVETKNVTLVLNNEEENQVLTFTVEEIPSLPSPRREGFKFEGWYTDESLADNAKYVPGLLVDDITLYAKWGEAPVYTGYYKGFNTYGSTSVGSAQSITIDEEGNISGLRSGFITNYDAETGVITWKTSEEAEDYFMLYKDGVIVCAYHAEKVLPQNDIFVFGKDNVSTALNIALGSEKNDRLVSLEYADRTVLVYVQGDKLYVGVTIETLTGESVEMTAIIGGNVDTLVIKHEGVVVGEYVKSGSEMMPMDGNQGTYTNGSETLFLNGQSLATLNGVEGRYEVNDGFIGVYVEETYYEVVLDKENLTFTKEKPMVDITFDAGDYANVESINVNKNIVVELPQPTSDTHIFRGWYFDEELTQAVDNSYNPTETLTLYAKWDEKINLRVVYGNDLEDVVIYYGVGDITNPVEPGLTNGLAFAGWYLDDEFTTPYTPTAIYESQVIYCKWKEAHPMYGEYKGYEVYAYSNNGIPQIGYSITTLIVDENGNVTGNSEGRIEDYNPETGEFKFVTYSTKYGVFDKESKTIAYAYSSNTETLGTDYYLLFNAEYVSFSDCSSYWDNFNAFMIEQIFNGEKVNVFVFNNKIYYDVTIESTTAGVTAATAYTANDLKIYDKDNNLVAEYVNNGSGLVYLDGYQGTYTSDATTMVLNGAGSITLDDATGTYILENGVICATINGEYFEITVNKVAMTFVKEKPMVTITFDTNGLAVVESINTNKKIDIELPQPTCDSHVFDGWYKDAELTQKIYGDYTPLENTTLYAKWNAKVTLTVVYGNGMENVELYYSAGDYTNPVVPGLTNNLAFEGWYLDAEFTNPYTPGVIQEDLTIYCKWQAPHALFGEYKGYEIWGSGSISIGWSQSSIFIDGSGNVTGSKTGVVADYNPETGTFYIESESYYGDLTRYFAKYDAENGVLAYAFSGNTTTLGNDAYFFFKDVEKVSITTDDGCGFLGGNTKILAFTIDDKVVNVFVHNDAIYYNVTFTSTTPDVTAKTAKDADDLIVYDAEGNVIVSFVKGDNGLQVA